MDTAIIQFIGIVLFSAQVPNDPGVHAILPRIGHFHKSDIHRMQPRDKTLTVDTRQTRDIQHVLDTEQPLHTEHALHTEHTLDTEGALDTKQTLAKEQTGEDQPAPSGIENHISVLMYRDEDRLYWGGGWSSDGKLANGWNFLALDGERVQFLTHGGDGEPKIPAILPRTGNGCGKPTAPPSLSAEFLPPYEGAAAVIDIPEGQLSSCQTSTVNVGARLDTRLILETRGVLVIAATKKSEEPKALVLRGDAVVFVANIPPYALLRDTDETIGEPHWTAYNAMLAEPCAERPAVAKSEAETLIAYCDLSSLGEPYYRARKEPPIENKLIDSGCSNTQWP